MADKLVKLRPVSAATSIVESGISTTQQLVLPVNGLTTAGGLAVDRGEYIYVSDFVKHVIYRYRRGSGTVTGNSLAVTSQIFAGAYGVSGNKDGQGSVARFNAPASLCVDKSGRVWIIDSGNALVRRMDPNGNVYTVAAIPAADAAQIGGIAVDDSENLYYVTSSNATI